MPLTGMYWGKRTGFYAARGLPRHIYAGIIESRRLIVHAGTTRLISLRIDGEKHPKRVFLREIQRDAVDRQLLHVDFYQVKMGEKMVVDVPIVLVGEAPAMKGKGRMLAHSITSLNVECLPDKVPPQIEVDVSTLEEVEQAIHVRDIVLDPDITVNAEPEQLVVKVTEAVVKVEEVEEVAVEEEAVEAEAEAPAGEAAEQPPAEPAPEKE